eukprot:UN09085
MGNLDSFTNVFNKKNQSTVPLIKVPS